MGFWEMLGFAVKIYIWIIKHIDIYAIVAGIAMTISGIATGEVGVTLGGLAFVALGIGLRFLIKWWKNGRAQD